MKQWFGVIWAVVLMGILMGTSVIPAGAADVPTEITYQGYLTDSGGTAIEGNTQIKFRIYDTATLGTGTLKWNETQTVPVIEGLFSAILGGSNPMTADVFDTASWLEIEVGSDGPMDPRQEITSVAYAIQAENAETLDGIDSASFMLAGTDNWVDESGDTIAGSLLVNGNNAYDLGSSSNRWRRSYVYDAYVYDDLLLYDNASIYGNVSVDGSLYMSNAETDDDTIYFDFKDYEYLRWNEAADGFDLSDDLNVTGTVTATGFVGDGSGLTGISATGDNLGDHTATQNINLNGNYLSGDGTSEGIYVDADGDVGIGTAVPDTRLHIRSYENQLKIGSNNQPSLEWTVNVNPTAYMNFTNEANGTPVTVMQLRSTGNVGIMTTSPAYTLDVTGDINYTGDLYNSGVPLAIPDGHSLDADDGSPVDAVYVNSAGNVGIGTTSPTGKLDIRGDEVRIWDGSAAVGYATGPGELYVENHAEFDNNIYIDEWIVNDSDTDTAIRFNDDEFITYTGGEYLFKVHEDATQDYVKLGDGGDVDINLNDDMIVEGSSGNVGIGTTTPGRALEVNGGYQTARLSSSSSGAFLEYVSNDDDWAVGTWNDSLRLIYSDDNFDSQNDEYWFTTDSFSPFVNDSNSIGSSTHRWSTAYAVDGDFSGNVGIGTSSPTEALEVTGGILMTSDSASKLKVGRYSAGSPYSYISARDANQMRLQIDDTTKLTIDTSGNIGIGTTSPDVPLTVDGNENNGVTAGVKITNSTQTMLLDGNEIDSLNGELYLNNNSGNDVVVPVIQITGGSDLAEPFDIEGPNEIEAGTVLVIDQDNPGKLRIADGAYDRCVAGVISGAGGINPGMIMGQDGSVADGTNPVALSGRVYCLVDASNGPIEPGDLLTTSDTPGHAMKVTDFEKAQGAILGKAMSSLEQGQGLVLILVTLQ